MRKIIEKGVISILAFSMIVMVFGTFTKPIKAAEIPAEYTIYPTPQNVVYEGESTFLLSNDVNVVYEQGIDTATRNRTDEAMRIKGMNGTLSNEIVSGKTNILVGINGSGGAVDRYFTDKDSVLFSKFDAYQLSVKDNVIAILGKDTDAAFMGMTTLKHIFNQVKDTQIRQLTIKDYAEVENRGFIEGYYGNPWSNEDRADLMTYGGDYKLNQYIYAPKDDPKHNSAWKTMYTADELKGIEKTVAAGNASKCYYVYALHPFMADAMRFDTEENYQADLSIVKQKFTQLMDAGVKQFSILADDASVPYGGSVSYVKLMVDLNNWLKEQTANYEGLRTDLTFCPSDYYGNAASEEMQGLKTLPEEVSVIQTGGWIWGSTNNEFLNTYETNMDGSHPFMWINWPCSDGTKDSLIMGGMERFLIPGADPNKMRGIVLNPMMQSEANKQSLFAVADYSWNVWQDQNDVDKMWQDSFNYMDHGTNEETDASVGLRELSKHMMNSNTGIPESVELSPKLTEFRKDFESGKDISLKANALIDEFVKLKKHATNYKTNPGNTRTRDQIIYWLDCWEDRMDAGINYLKAALAIQNKESNDAIWSYFANAQASFEKSKSNEYWYLNHFESATVGRQHLTPFIESLDKTLATKVSSIVDPTKQVVTYITNRSDITASDQEKILDNDPGTEVIYKNPNVIDEGTYIGISYTKAITLKQVSFLTGHAGNLNDTFSKTKVEYTADGTNWVALNGIEYNRQSEITLKELDVEIKGIRLIATETKSNAWLGVRDIVVNPSEEEQVQKYTGTITLDKIQVAGGNISNISDASESSFAHLKEVVVADATIVNYIPVDATLTLTFDEAKQLGKVNFVQDKGTDSITDIALEYSVNGVDWIEIGTYSNTATIDVNLSDNKILAKAIRIRNKSLKLNDAGDAGYWWKVYNLSVSEPVEGKVDTSTPINPIFEKSDRMSIYSGNTANLADGNESTDIEFSQGDPNKDNAIVGDFIGYDLGRLAYIGEVDIVVGGKRDASNKWEKYNLEYSKDGVNWTVYKEYTGKSSGKDIIHENLKGEVGRYIRLVNQQNRAKWVLFSEFRVRESLEVAVEKFIYTNTDYALKTMTLLDSTELVFNELITLNKNQYVGVKMARIKDLTSLEVALTNTPDVKIQTSINGVDWMNVSDYNDVKASRYVRIINTTENPISFNIDKFIIHSNEVMDPYLLEATMTINGSYGGTDSRENGAAFDGDVNTVTNFSDYPSKGQYILYDLGQMRNINAIKLYVQDTLRDYIRDAKFYVSEDKNTWNEVMEIGDGIENTQDSQSIAKDSGLYKADSTYPNKFYAEETGLAVKGRYLKIEFTASYRHRFVFFNEILINGGEYVPTINDPSFETTAVEKRGYSPQNMFDGDLTTSYLANTNEAGNLVYHLSENLKISKINIVQKGITTNAKVGALVDSKVTRSTREWIEMGTLNKSLNEILNPFYENVYALKIEWKENQVPQLSEMVLVRDKALLPDRSALQTYVDGLNIDGTKYTTTTYEAFTSKLGEAKAILVNNNSTQKNIDDAKLALETAVASLLVKGDLSALRAKVRDVEALKETDYTVDSFNALKAVLTEAKACIQNANNTSQVQANAMLDKLQVAQTNLVSAAPMAKQALKDYIVSNQFEDLDGSLYLTKGFATFEKALTDALALVADAVSPTVDECQAAYDTLKATRAALVLRATREEIQSLENTITLYEEVGYTPSSWNVFMITVEKVKLVVQGNEMSSVDVANAKTEVLNAAKKLDVRGDRDAFITRIEEFENIDSSLYTRESYNKLKIMIMEARALLNQGNELSQDEITEALNKLFFAEQGLKLLSDEGVNTGDSTNVNYFNTLALISLLVVGFILFKKRTRKE